MSCVGIVANPASGKDIRRLIASGTVIGNREKAGIIVRALMAMDALGVERVAIMPDSGGIGARAMDRVAGKLRTSSVEFLDLPQRLGTFRDTLNSVRRLREASCSSIIVLGGDGTSRVAAKESGPVPLISVSTGTNNVFPQMVEGTLAGLAAATLERGVVRRQEVCERRPRLELLEAGKVMEIALVDLAVVDSADFGARAVWEPDSLRELFLASCPPAAIGLSAIGACLPGRRPAAGEGLRVCFGEGGVEVIAPIGPGLMEAFRVAEFEAMAAGQWFALRNLPAMVALDGEREYLARAERSPLVRLNRDGPVVVQVEKAVELAAARGLFAERSSAASVAQAAQAAEVNGRSRQ